MFRDIAVIVNDCLCKAGFADQEFFSISNSFHKSKEVFNDEEQIE